MSEMGIIHTPYSLPSLSYSSLSIGCICLAIIREVTVSHESVTSEGLADDGVDTTVEFLVTSIDTEADGLFLEPRKLLSKERKQG